LYAIFPKYPDNKKLILKSIIPYAATTVSFLSTKEKLQWHQQGDDVVIELPDYDPNKIKSPYAYVVKIENYGMFAPKPTIKVEYEKSVINPVISLTVPLSGSTIFYTTDGSEPGAASKVYEGPFTINQTCIIKAKTFFAGSIPGKTLIEKVKTYNWVAAVKTTNLKPGIDYKYYQPEQNINMLSSFKTNLINSGVADIISVAKKQRTDKFAFEFSGYIKIDKDAVYDFFIASDDGSKLFIDDEEVVDNDGDHGTVEKSGKAALKKGYHKIKVLYFDSGGGNELKVFIQTQGGIKQELAAGILFH
jgi:hypothetical protein